MALHPARQEELKQLVIFKDLANSQANIGFKLDLKKAPGNLDYSDLLVTVSGLKVLVVSGSGYRATTEGIPARFVIPPGHPNSSRVSVSFTNPVPFHPHVYTNGSICWGSVATSDAGSWTLTLWTIAVLEYLQMNQRTFIGVNTNSPANSSANAWYQQNRRKLDRTLPSLDFSRIRKLADQAIG